MITSMDYSTPCISNISSVVYDIAFYTSIWISFLMFLSLFIILFILFICHYNRSLNKCIPKSVNDFKALGGITFGICFLPLLIAGPLAVVSFLVNFWGTIVSILNSVFVVSDFIINFWHNRICCVCK